MFFVNFFVNFFGKTVFSNFENSWPTGRKLQLFKISKNKMEKWVDFFLPTFLLTFLKKVSFGIFNRLAGLKTGKLEKCSFPGFWEFLRITRHTGCSFFFKGSGWFLAICSGAAALIKIFYENHTGFVVAKNVRIQTSPMCQYLNCKMPIFWRR